MNSNGLPFNLSSSHWKAFLHKDRLAEEATHPYDLQRSRIELNCFTTCGNRPRQSVFGLVKQLSRDYSRVHAGIEMLKNIGHVDDDNNGLVVPYSCICSEIDLERA